MLYEILNERGTTAESRFREILNPNLPYGHSLYMRKRELVLVDRRRDLKRAETKKRIWRMARGEGQGAPILIPVAGRR
jgi:hypothetical protein